MKLSCRVCGLAGGDELFKRRDKRLCKACDCAQSKERYRANAEKVKAKALARREGMREELRLKAIEYREANAEALKVRRAEDYKKRGEILRERSRQYNREHGKAIYQKQKASGRHKEKIDRRRAAEKLARPPWEDAAKLRAVYLEAIFLSKATGEQYHVDHIVPLQNRLVCGLHVVANLRVVRATENMAKGNSWWPDMPICCETEDGG